MSEKINPEKIERALNKLAKDLARDFGIEPPKVTVADSVDRCKEKCLDVFAGCYVSKNKEIVVCLIDERIDEYSVFLHELAHHIQYIFAEEDVYRAFPSQNEVHCERPHERDAKVFEKFFFPYAYKRWLKYVKGEKKDKS